VVNPLTTLVQAMDKSTVGSTTGLTTAQIQSKVT